MATYDIRIIHLAIQRDWREVYEFCIPENFPLWASGLASGLTRNGDEWVAQGPGGEARIRFVPRNDFGVLDHVVTLADGTQVSSPLRIVANGDGCEVMFTLFRTPGMSEETFAADADWVRRDLESLKRLMEKAP